MSKTLLREEQDVPRRKARQKERRALHQVLAQIDLNTDQTQIDEMISQRVEKNPIKTADSSIMEDIRSELDNIEDGTDWPTHYITGSTS